MNEQQPTSRPPKAEEYHSEERPIRTPSTDPTNPWHQEAAGEWVQAEHDPERREGVHSPPVK
jgi:hypothetical protein